MGLKETVEMGGDVKAELVPSCSYKSRKFNPHTMISSDSLQAKYNSNFPEKTSPNKTKNRHDKVLRTKMQ